MKELICVVCPIGCHLKITEDLVVTGNKCARGKTYAIAEMTNPQRSLSSTVKTIFLTMPRLPVKTSQPVLKKDLMAIMDEINKVVVDYHVKTGDVIIKNVLNTGIDVVATSFCG